MHIFEVHLTKFCGSSGVSFADAKTVLPNLTGKNITGIYQLYPSYFVIMRNKKTMYIGEVLDIFKKGNNSKYGSLEFATSALSLSFMAVRVYLPLQLGNVCVYWCPYGRIPYAIHRLSMTLNQMMPATTVPYQRLSSLAVGEANMTCTHMHQLTISSTT